MKKKHAFLFLYLFFSSILFGQIDNKSNPAPDDDCNQVDIWIDKIVWNANESALINVMDNYPNSPYPIEYLDYDISQSTFHIVVLQFGANNSRIHEAFDFDASLYLSYARNKPIYFVYPGDFVNASPVNNYKVRFWRGSSNSSNKSDDGGGVITAIGVKGRSRLGGKVASGWGGGFPNSGSGSHCMDLEIKNDLANGCAASQPIFSTKCATIAAFAKVETDDISINSYPNPVRNHLFVETDGLDVRAINLLNLQGQSLSHQVNVSHTESTWQVNTSKLEAGLYILQVETDAGLSVKKVYVQ